MNLSGRKALLLRKQQSQKLISTYRTEISGILLQSCHTAYTILSLEETDAITEVVRNSKPSILHKETSSFNDKSNLQIALNKMVNLNKGDIFFMFTRYSNLCGAAKINNLECININFSFDAEHSGIIVLVSGNFTKKLIIDFYEEKGGRWLDVEMLDLK